MKKNHVVSKRKKKTYKDKKISLDSCISIAIFSAMIYEARPIQVSRKETDIYMPMLIAANSQSPKGGSIPSVH